MELGSLASTGEIVVGRLVPGGFGLTGVDIARQY